MKSVAPYASPFFGYFVSVLAILCLLIRYLRVKAPKNCTLSFQNRFRFHAETLQKKRIKIRNLTVTITTKMVETWVSEQKQISLEHSDTKSSRRFHSSNVAAYRRGAVGPPHGTQ